MTNNFGEIEIIWKIDDRTGRNYLIKFLNTGTEIVANGSRFKSGDIKDPMAKTVCGVACFGIGPHRVSFEGKTTREASMWYNMIKRCYSDVKTERQVCYIGCTVCDRWLNYQNFCEDIENIPGYQEWKNPENNFALDKDGIVKGNKVYSPETCQFIYEGDNTKLSNISKSVYKGISPENEIFYFKNQRIFSEKYGLDRRGISAVVSGQQKTHKKWKFKRISQEEIENINPELIQE